MQREIHSCLLRCCLVLLVCAYPGAADDAAAEDVGSPQALGHELEDSGYLFARQNSCPLCDKMLARQNPRHVRRLTLTFYPTDIYST